MRERNKAWKDFTVWCQTKSLAELPANAWTIAAYVRFNEHKKEHAELVEAMKEIARRHLLKGYADPVVDKMVTSTLDRVANRQRNRHHHSDLFDEPETVREPVHEPVEEAPPPPELAVPRKTMSNAPKLVRRKR